jgi:hypothetical protein
MNVVSQWLMSSRASGLRLVPGEAGCIARAYAAHAMKSTGLAAAALQPLMVALRALQPEPDYMTPFHAAFLQACVSNYHDRSTFHCQVRRWQLSSDMY